MKFKVDTGKHRYLNAHPVGQPPLPDPKIITADKYTFETMAVGDAGVGHYSQTYLHFWRGDLRVASFPSFQSVELVEDETAVAEAA